MKTLLNLISRDAIAGLTSDSRAVKPGSLFFAIKGATFDGHLKINEAFENGAEYIVGELPVSELKGLKNPNRYLQVPSSRRALALAACEFYRHPSRSVQCIGVTGTSGKTTTAFYLYESLMRRGIKTGLIGTVENRIGAEVAESTHTTPDPVSLQALMAQMKKEGCEVLVMEVSSHALDQDRTYGVEWAGVGFLNLSPEHMDYHPTLEHYFKAKRNLFFDSLVPALDSGRYPVAALSVSTSWGARLISEIINPSVLKTAFDPASFEGSIDANGIQGGAKIFDTGFYIQSPLFGAFNLENLMIGSALLYSLNLPALGAPFSPERRQMIEDSIAKFRGAPGRLENIQNPKGLHILVDYAHKPDALEKVLRALRPLVPEGRHLWTVFGCGGDRDTTKRPVMGEIAARLSDYVILTSDNPRTENPATILDAIEAGIPAQYHGKIKREADRKKAIERALSKANAGDLVLIAGKGHETCQIIGTTKTPFDDRRVVRNAFPKP